jgi:hypothetical protein
MIWLRTKTMEEIQIITEDKINKSGDKTWTIKYECDICKKDNYPMASWSTDDDPFIHTIICLDCIEKIGFDLHHYEEPEEQIA